MSENKNEEELIPPKKELSEWIKEASESKLIPWEKFPEIYLYMDQVLTFMDSQLNKSEHGKNVLLTSSMVNNYVKDGILPRPEKKKYSKDHLAQLTILCLLKQVLSIQDIHALMDDLLSREEKENLYKDFCGIQEDSLRETCSRISEAESKDSNEALALLAMQFAAEAGARRTAAEHIIKMLRRESEQQSKE